MLASPSMSADAEPRASVRFVVLAAPRTGSNWLCTLLDSHPEVLCHHEIFNPAGLHYSLRLRDGGFDLGTVAERDRSPEVVLKRVWQRSLGRRAVGFKLNRDQDERVFRRVLADPGVRTILLRRRNRIRTYVSERIAERTGQWESYGKIGAESRVEPRRLDLDAAALRAGVERNERYYAGLEEELRGGRRPHLSLVYERLGDEEERRRMLRFLDVAERPELLTGGTRKQNPFPLRETITNFAQLARELRGSDLETDLDADDP